MAPEVVRVIIHEVGRVPDPSELLPIKDIALKPIKPKLMRKPHKG